MSVLIKGIRIPESCAKCRFCVNGFTDEAPMYECACQSYDIVSVLVDDNGQPFNFRPDWCPLVEVPPHGRLIDADKATEESMKRTGKRLLAIDTAPTIIEAEGSEERADLTMLFQMWHTSSIH